MSKRIPSTELPSAVHDPLRLAALASYGILDTPPEQGFDDIVQLARQICGAPVALVSLVAGDRQWFKAREGFPSCETGLNASVCAHALTEPDLLVIPNLATDPRTRNNPLVIGPPYIQFYAGAPLRTAEGHVLGSLCVIDHRPRPEGLAEARREALRALARQVVTQLELRRVSDLQRKTLDQRAILIRTQNAVAAAQGDLDTILAALVSGAMAAIPQAEGAVIQMREGEALVYRATHGTLVGHTGLQLPLHGSLAGSCVLSGEGYRVGDVRADPRVKQELIEALQLRSCVIVPVRRGGETVGALKIQSSQPEAFTDADLAQAEVFAGTVTAGLAEAGEAAARRETSRLEQRRQAVFDSAHDYAMIVLDLDGKVTDWNSGASKILGWQPEEMCGSPADRFFTPEDRAAGIPAKEMQAALETGRGIDERWHLRRNGERFWALGEMMPLRDGADAVIGFVKILRDRTEQRNAEAKQQADAEFMRSVLSSSADCIKVLELDGRMAFMNEGGLKVMELSDFNLVKGCPWPDFWQGQGHIDALKALDAARAGGIGHFQGAANTYLGNPRWWDVQVTSIRGPNGQPERLLSVSRDITGQKTIEAQLTNSEARWRGLFEGMHEGFFLGELIRDASGRAFDYRFIEINPAFAQQSGLPIDSVGRTMRSFVPDIDQGLIDTYARVVETGEPALFEITVPDLNRTFEVRANGERSERFSCLFLDVSQRKRDEARRAALAELGEHLRNTSDKAKIARVAAEILGRTLGLSHAGYGEVDHDQETILVDQGWTAPGLPSIAGVHAFRDYGSYIDSLKNGHAVIIDDVAGDPRTASDASALAAIDVRSLLNLPLMERGRFVALLFALKSEPYAWKPEEISFATSIADRTRAALARIEAEEQQLLLNHELSHRMKNLLAMVQSIATQTMRNAADVETAKDVLAGRLIALGKAHDLLMGGALTSTRMVPVIRGALDVHGDGGDRFRIAGPDIDIGPDRALSLALMLHELATNAAKYGALTTEHGYVDLRWEILPNDDEPQLRLTWAEVGGPPVVAPIRKGFGSRFIERGLVSQVGGTLALAYPATGVTCTISAPLSAFRMGH